MNNKFLQNLGFTNNVNRSICTEDKMFQGNEKHYFDVMESAMKSILVSMQMEGKTKANNILDFGCGCGRVLRGLRATFPEARIVAADINKPCVDFCCENFRAEPLYLESWPPSLKQEGKFDLIWSGSVFTHLPEDRSIAFLELLLNSLAAGGILVCTFHGRHSIERQKNRRKYISDEKFENIIRGYNDSGYGFFGEPPGTYGISVIKPSWLMNILENMPGIRIVTYKEREWDNHQDVLACVKD